MSFLRAISLSLAYGKLEVIFDVSFEVQEHKIVTLLGSNGTGKSTLLKALCGVLTPTNGDIHFLGRSIKHLSARQRVNEGIVLVPEGRLPFPYLSVFDNLRVAALSRLAKPHFEKNLQRVYNLFPRLSERKRQQAGTLSGGEQQMLAIGRGLMAHPVLLMLDEPSAGLAPILIKELFRSIRDINRQGTTILLIEQNAYRSLEISDSGYVLENGMITLYGSAVELLSNVSLKKAYMGL